MRDAPSRACAAARGHLSPPWPAPHPLRLTPAPPPCTAPWHCSVEGAAQRERPARGVAGGRHPQPQHRQPQGLSTVARAPCCRKILSVFDCCPAWPHAHLNDPVPGPQDPHLPPPLVSTRSCAHPPAARAARYHPTTHRAPALALPPSPCLSAPTEPPAPPLPSLPPPPSFDLLVFPPGPAAAPPQATPAIHTYQLTSSLHSPPAAGLAATIPGGTTGQRCDNRARAAGGGKGAQAGRAG